MVYETIDDAHDDEENLEDLIQIKLDNIDKHYN